MKYNIGDYVRDEDGNFGVVVIKYNDGDLCYYENDAAHPNPKTMQIFEVKDIKTNKSYTLTETFNSNDFDLWLENEEGEGMSVSEQNLFDVLDKYFSEEF